MRRRALGKVVRKVIPAGGSLAVTLPTDYVRAHGIKPGDRIELTYNHVFVGKPIKPEELEEKLTEVERTLGEVKPLRRLRLPRHEASSGGQGTGNEGGSP